MAKANVKKVRLEKKDGKRTLFIEFQLIAGNSIMRVWNKFVGPVNTISKDRENFQTPEKLAEYIKNQKAALEKEGWALAGSGAATPAPTASASDLQ